MIRTTLALILSAALSASASAPAPVAGSGPDGSARPPAPAPPSADGYHRVELPAGTAKFPYTLEIPAGWQVHELKKEAALWLGPAGETDPNADPGVVYIRISRASVAEPEKVVENIKKNASSPDAGWTPAMVEVKEVGGVRGVLVQMESGSGASATSTLVLKLPLPKTSVDFIARSPRAEFASRRAAYERILFSVRRAE